VERKSQTLRRACVAATTVVIVAFAADVSLASVHAITRSAAKAVATAISLRQSDLPTLKQISNPITPQQLRLNAQAVNCAGGVPLSKAYANTQSPEFVGSGSPSVTIVSSVEILPSAALVAKDFAAIERPKTLRCLVSEVSSAFRSALPKSESLNSGGATRLASIVSGTGPSFDIRLTFAVSVHKGTSTVRVPIYVDQIGFAEGQAEITLELQMVPTKPSTSLEQRLAAALVTRARAAVR
jgi:hypothetical protein